LSEEPLPEKRVTAGNLLLAAGVVTIIQLFALSVTRLNSPTYVAIVNSTGPSFAPLGTSPVGSTLNAVVFVAFAFALTLGLVWLVRKKMVRSFKMVIFISVAFSAFVLTLVTADVFAVEYLPPSLEL